MKREHKELINSKLPAILLKLEEVLHAHGLENFSISNLRLFHDDEGPICNPPCTGTKTCKLVIIDGELVPACR